MTHEQRVIKEKTGLKDHGAMGSHLIKYCLSKKSCLPAGKLHRVIDSFSCQGMLLTHTEPAINPHPPVCKAKTGNNLCLN